MKRILLALALLFGFGHYAQALPCGASGGVSCDEVQGDGGITYTVTVGDIGGLRLVAFAIDFTLQAPNYDAYSDVDGWTGDVNSGQYGDLIDYEDGVDYVVYSTDPDAGNPLGQGDGGEFYLDGDVEPESDIQAVCQDAAGATVNCADVQLVAEAPEPAGLGLLGLGLVGLALIRRRKVFAGRRI